MNSTPLPHEDFSAFEEYQEKGQGEWEQTHFGFYEKMTNPLTPEEEGIVQQRSQSPTPEWLKKYQGRRNKVKIQRIAHDPSKPAPKKGICAGCGQERTLSTGEYDDLCPKCLQLLKKDYHNVFGLEESDAAEEYFSETGRPFNKERMEQHLERLESYKKGNISHEQFIEGFGLIPHAITEDKSKKDDQ